MIRLRILPLLCRHNPPRVNLTQQLELSILHHQPYSTAKIAALSNRAPARRLVSSLSRLHSALVSLGCPLLACIISGYCLSHRRTVVCEAPDIVPRQAARAACMRSVYTTALYFPSPWSPSKRCFSSLTRLFKCGATIFTDIRLTHPS